MARPAHGRWRALAGATGVLAGLLGGGAAGTEDASPVAAQVLRKTRLDAQALRAIRERTRALVEALQQEALASERSLEGTVQAIRGDTLYLRTGPARSPLIVPLELQPSTRVRARSPALHRPAGAAARPRLREGETVRARFTVSPDAPHNRATAVEATPPGPPPPVAPPPAQR